MGKQDVVDPHDGTLSGNQNEFPTHATTWINLNDIRLSERNQTQNTYCMIPFLKDV